MFVATILNLWGRGFIKKILARDHANRANLRIADKTQQNVADLNVFRKIAQATFVIAAEVMAWQLQIGMAQITRSPPANARLAVL